MSRFPEVKWAQRLDVVYVTVQLPDAKNATTNIDPEGNFTFSATVGSENHQYNLKLEFFDKVNVEESKISTGVRSVFCVIKKAENGWWKKLLRGDGKTPHFLKVDWDKWVDEDDDKAPAEPEMGGMDFSNFGGMEGMMGGLGGRMGGLGGGMGGLGGGMGGLGGGMGGLGGGMGGLGGGMDGLMGGGMGDFPDDSDDEDEIGKSNDHEVQKKEEKSEGRPEST